MHANKRKSLACVPTAHTGLETVGSIRVYLRALADTMPVKKHQLALANIVKNH